MIVENSGLLTVAALKHLKPEGKKVASILSGGNMDVITMSSVIQHGLILRDRIFTVSVLLPDRAGELARVAAVIAEQQGNVIKLDHNQFFSTNRNAAVELKITVEAFGTEHKEKIVKALKDKGYKLKLTHATFNKYMKKYGYAIIPPLQYLSLKTICVLGRNGYRRKPLSFLTLPQTWTGRFPSFQALCIFI